MVRESVVYLTDSAIIDDGGLRLQYGKINALMERPSSPIAAVSRRSDKVGGDESNTGITNPIRVVHSLGAKHERSLQHVCRL